MCDACLRMLGSRLGHDLDVTHFGAPRPAVLAGRARNVETIVA
jgi:hypothetical protein